MSVAGTCTDRHAAPAVSPRAAGGPTVALITEPARFRSGIPRYARELTGALLELEGPGRFLFVDKQDGGPFDPARTLVVRHPLGPLLSTYGWYPWLAATLGPRADVVHNLSQIPHAFRFDGKTVLTIHDLTPLLFPTLYSPLKWAVYRALLPATLRRTDRVICGSERTRDDLASCCGFPPERVRVIPYAAPSGFAPSGKAAAVAADRGLRRPYLIQVGSLERRKNHAVTIEALALLARRGIEPGLAIVGQPGPTLGEVMGRVEAFGLTGSVRFLTGVSDGELAALYAGAQAALYPSLYEGFGIPLLEAMTCGCPVVAGRAGAIPETAGDAAELVDPRSPTELANAIERILRDDDHRALLVARGKARAAEFTWRKAAEETMKVYEEAAGL